MAFQPFDFSQPYELQHSFEHYDTLSQSAPKSTTQDGSYLSRQRTNLSSPSTQSRLGFSAHLYDPAHLQNPLASSTTGFQHVRAMPPTRQNDDKLFKNQRPVAAVDNGHGQGAYQPGSDTQNIDLSSPFGKSPHDSFIHACLAPPQIPGLNPGTGFNSRNYEEFVQDGPVQASYAYQTVSKSPAEKPQGAPNPPVYQVPCPPVSRYDDFWSGQFYYFDQNGETVRGAYHDVLRAHPEHEAVIFDLFATHVLQKHSAFGSQFGSSNGFSASSARFQSGSPSDDATGSFGASSTRQPYGNAATARSSPSTPYALQSTLASQPAPTGVPTHSVPSFPATAHDLAQLAPSNHGSAAVFPTTSPTSYVTTHASYDYPLDCFKIPVSDDDWKAQESKVPVIARQLYNALLHPFKPDPGNLDAVQLGIYTQKQKSALSELQNDIAVASQDTKARSNCLKLAHRINCIHKFGIDPELKATYEKKGSTVCNRKAHFEKRKCSSRSTTVLKVIKNNKRLALDVAAGRKLDDIARAPSFELDQKIAWMKSNKQRDEVLKKAKSIIGSNQIPVTTSTTPVAPPRKIKATRKSKAQTTASLALSASAPFVPLPATVMPPSVYSAIAAPPNSTDNPFSDLMAHPYDNPSASSDLTSTGGLPNNFKRKVSTHFGEDEVSDAKRLRYDNNHSSFRNDFCNWV